MDEAALGDALSLTIEGGERVSARLMRPVAARACYVLAHGAGAGMEHPFIRAAARELAGLGIATLRYQFPYIECGSRRPDPPPLCHATVRAAVSAAAAAAPGLPLFAGGRSFGGRMTSQAQALHPLPGVRGLAFLGFPLHPAGQPSEARAKHLGEVRIPMLFVQGTRDALAERTHLKAVIERLAPRATVYFVEDADHSFHVPAKSGRKDGEVRQELLRAVHDWIESLR